MATSHVIDYQIKGESIQIVEVELDPMETVIDEVGEMLFREEGIRVETKMGDGSNPSQGLFDKLLSAGSRLLTGESLLMTHFTNRGNKKEKVGFSAPYPGTVIPVDLSQSPGNELIVQKDGFLCAAFGTKLSIFFNRKIGAGLVGGEGFILEKLQGDGKTFIHAGGTVIERTLNNETLRVDTGCVVAFESQIDFDVETTGSLKTMIFGGGGIVLATIMGTGKVGLQSMPIRKLVQSVA